MPANIRYSSIKVRSRRLATKGSTKGKVRVGFVVGPKNCDPILPGTQERDWPEELKVKNNTGPSASGWGGQFQVDVQLPLRLQRLHSDVFAVDIIPGNAVTPARLARNHVNFNIGYDLVNAFMSKSKRHESQVRAAFYSKESHLWPEWDMQDWIYQKDRYMLQCQRAGIDIIDTIFLNNGIAPADVLKRVKAKSWDRFFLKPSYLGSFGMAGGKFNTKECSDNPSILQNFQDNDAAGYRRFMVQPYVLRPDGKVFDEVRNFFIDGKWAYAVYTDGTDDNKVYFVQKGPYLDDTREIATRAFAEVLKVAKWRGERFVPPMIRVDVGVIPDPARGPRALKVFINEIEMEAATWLVRYCPFDLVSRMAQVYPKKILELLTRLGKTGERVPDAEAMQKLRSIVGGEPAAGALPQPAKAGKKRSADEASQPDARHRAAARVAGA